MGKVDGIVERKTRGARNVWESGDCTQNLLRIYRWFYYGFEQSCSLFFAENWGFAHRTTNTTILYNKEREIIWK